MRGRDVARRSRWCDRRSPTGPAGDVHASAGARADDDGTGRLTVTGPRGLCSPRDPWFSSPAEAATRLADAGYLADPATATTAYLAGALEKPLLVEGPAGVGKTELAKAVSRATGAELVRLQCYEGLDEARALYEWNYKKQLLRIQASQATTRPGRRPTTTSSPRSSC